MRSVYVPAAASIPRPLTFVEPIPGSLGGDCIGATVSRRQTSSAVRTSPIDALLAPLVEWAGKPDASLRYSTIGDFQHGECRYRLPRFVHHGAPGGGNPIRLAVFAALRGDEPEGVMALRDLLLRLDAEPSIAAGYEIYAYPTCNPSGFEDHTPHSRAGADLLREFWRSSREPEVYYLERELGVHQFHGLISVRSGGPGAGLQVSVRGATLAEALTQPALQAAAPFLSAPTSASPAAGTMANADELKPLPFEVTLRSPGNAPAVQQAAALEAALGSILAEYRQFLAYGQDL